MSGALCFYYFCDFFVKNIIYLQVSVASLYCDVLFKYTYYVCIVASLCIYVFMIGTGSSSSPFFKFFIRINKMAPESHFNLRIFKYYDSNINRIPGLQNQSGVSTLNSMFTQS